MIYGAFYRGELRYIGKTIQSIQTRGQSHISEAKSGKSICHRLNWIRALIAAGRTPEFREIQRLYATDEELSGAEIYWIAHFKSLGCRLVNDTNGGEGASGYRISDEAQKRRVAKLRGRKRLPFSQDTKVKMSVAAKLRWSFPEERRKSGVSMSTVLIGNKNRLGKRDTNERRIARSRRLGGRPFEDQYGNRYETQRDAARLLGLSQGDIGRVLNGRYAQIKGFVFRYL